MPIASPARCAPTASRSRRSRRPPSGWRRRIPAPARSRAAPLSRRRRRRPRRCGPGSSYRAVADAIDQAQQALRGGDVLLIELQGLGPERRWIPVEFWPDVYDAIRVASARGVIVIEAAGNGAANLDARAYGGV